MLYLLTSSGIVHAVMEDSRNGENGYFQAFCGKWTRPTATCDDADRLSGRRLSGRMCKACEVKLKALKQKD